MASLSKLLCYLRYGKFREIGQAIGERIPSWIYSHRVAYIYEQEQVDAGDPEKKIELPEGYLSRLVGRDEMAMAGAIAGLRVGECYRRMDGGNICYAIFQEDRPVNINWIHRGSCYIRGMAYLHEASENDAYIYGVLTDLPQRGNGLYKKSLHLIERYLYGSGVRRLVQMVEEGNAAVLHTLPELGYRHTKTITYLACMGHRRTRIEDVKTGDVQTISAARDPNGVFRI